MPHVIVADDAFEAGRHLIKPYKPSSSEIEGYNGYN